MTNLKERCIMYNGDEYTFDELQDFYSIYLNNIVQLARVSKIENIKISDKQIGGNKETIKHKTTPEMDDSFINSNDKIKNLGWNLAENGSYWILLSHDNYWVEGLHRLTALHNLMEDGKLNPDMKFLSLNVEKTAPFKIKCLQDRNCKVKKDKIKWVYKTFDNFQKGGHEILIVPMKFLSEMFYTYKEKYGENFPASPLCNNYEILKEKCFQLKDIRLVEIEINSYCNRKCEWCPNKIFKRDFHTNLDEKIFIKLLTELSNVDYSNYISLSRYNEPFADIELLRKRIRQIRTFVPKATIVCNTNGDYGGKGIYGYENIDIDELTVMDYDNKKEEICVDKFRVMKNFVTNNRGDVLDEYAEKRINPCYEPYYFVGVNYDGTISPCCNIRNDIEKHKIFILGDLKDDTLTSILNGIIATRFRENVSKKNFPEICRNCRKMEGRYTRKYPSIRDSRW